MNEAIKKYKWAKVLSGLLLVTVINVLFAQTKQDNEMMKNRIDNYLNQSVDQGFSGAMLIYRKGEVILNKGYGYANKAKKLNNTPDTVFDVGSVSKQFTAAAILKLEQQNKLNVEDTLSKFFKDLPEDKKHISIHQLLIHSSGFINGIGKNDFDHIPLNDYFTKLFATKLLHIPGSKHMYSNAGYSILARIIEIVSGESYESYLNQNLFKPAGMKYTGYLLPKWENLNLAHGYSYNVLDTGSMAARYKTDGKISRVLLGNGGINSTQNDMFLWYKALQTEKVLSRELVKKLTTPYIIEFEGETSYYAYGWVVFKSPRNTDMIAHDGSNGTFFYDFRWFPKEEVLVLYASNSLTSKVGGMAWRIDKMLFDDSYQPKPIQEDFVTTLLRFSENHNGNLSQLVFNMKNQFKKQLDKPFYLSRLSGTYLRNNRFDKAEAIAILNIELFPNDSNIWDSLGQIYFDQGKLKKALKAYKKAVSIDTQNDYAREMINKIEG